MKKLVLFALLIAMVATLAFAAVQAPIASSVAAAGSACPNVGWNTRMCAGLVSDTSVQTLAIIVRPPATPNVGWNS